MNKAEERKRDQYYADPLAMPPECDLLCRFRPCYAKYEDKGSYTAGLGYTDYSSRFCAACATRLNHGCGSGRASYGRAEALRWVVKQLASKTKRDRDAAVRTLNAMAAFEEMQP